MGMAVSLLAPSSQEQREQKEAKTGDSMDAQSRRSMAKRVSAMVRTLSFHVFQACQAAPLVARTTGPRSTALCPNTAGAQGKLRAAQNSSERWCSSDSKPRGAILHMRTPFVCLGVWPLESLKDSPANLRLNRSTIDTVDFGDRAPWLHVQHSPVIAFDLVSAKQDYDSLTGTTSSRLTASLLQMQ